jgi:uncharacterized protein (TIGR02217 family)
LIESFVENRFPDDISYGASGGPEFKTEIFTTNNFVEQRLVCWPQARMRYNVSHGVKSFEQTERLIAFFRSKLGKAVGFRFKDYTDFIGVKQLLLNDNKSNCFQLCKIYDESYIRLIKKPVINTIEVYDEDGIEQNNWKADYRTGTITFDKTPKKKIYADFEFDVPVRFDIDYLNVSIDYRNFFSCNNITLIEIKI